MLTNFSSFPLLPGPHAASLVSVGASVTEFACRSSISTGLLVRCHPHFARVAGSGRDGAPGLHICVGAAGGLCSCCKRQCAAAGNTNHPVVRERQAFAKWKRTRTDLWVFQGAPAWGPVISVYAQNTTLPYCYSTPLP